MWNFPLVTTGKHLRQVGETVKVKSWQPLLAGNSIQIDVKELNDIPEMYREYIRHKLPTYQFTARCVRTGAMFLSYAKEKTVTNATVFLMRLAEHLHAHGVDLTQVTVQTDNGTEFTTPWNSLKDSAFTTVIKTRLYATHRLILFRAGRTFRRVEEPADTRFRRLTRKFSSLPANEKRRPAAATAGTPVTTVTTPQPSTTTYSILPNNSR